MNGWITLEKEMQQDVEGEDRLAKVIDESLTRAELAQAVDDIMIAIAKDEADDMDEDISLLCLFCTLFSSCTTYVCCVVCTTVNHKLYFRSWPYLSYSRPLHNVNHHNQ